MKPSHLMLFLFLLIGLGSCMNNKESKTASAEVKKEYVPLEIVPDTTIYIVYNDSMRQVVKKMGKKLAYATQMALKKELQQTIKSRGLVEAISFCNTRAMEITDSISLVNQAKIRRLAKKNRNPLNAMDENESNLYKSYVLDFLGKQPAYATVSWNEQGAPVYYHPMYVDALCLNCHGTAGEEVLPEVAERIAQLYPEDKAMDFKKGDPRGMWSITFPVYRITDLDNEPEQQKVIQ